MVTRPSIFIVSLFRLFSLCAFNGHFSYYQKLLLALTVFELIGIWTLDILPLQDFTPEAGRYDVIWIQWCIGQLADDDFVAFFKRAKVCML